MRQSFNGFISPVAFCWMLLFKWVTCEQPLNHFVPYRYLQTHLTVIKGNPLHVYSYQLNLSMRMQHVFKASLTLTGIKRGHLATKFSNWWPAEKVPIVHSHEVCKKLLSVQATKATGPDNIPPRIIKEFAYKLAEPVTLIFNASLCSGEVPALWKDSNITPTPEGETAPVRRRYTAHLPFPYLIQSLGRLRGLLDDQGRWWVH